jgi:hypothetical protein
VIRQHLQRHPGFDRPEGSNNQMSPNTTKVQQRSRSLAPRNIIALAALFCIGFGLFIAGIKADSHFLQIAMLLLSWFIISIPIGVMFGYLNLSEQ